MKDVYGRNLEIGDKVAFNISGYNQLHIGIITRFTKKLIWIKYPDKYDDEKEYSRHSSGVSKIIQ